MFVCVMVCVCLYLPVRTRTYTWKPEASLRYGSSGFATLFYEVGVLTALELPKQVRLTGQWASLIPLFLLTGDDS